MIEVWRKGGCAVCGGPDRVARLYGYAHDECWPKGGKGRELQILVMRACK